MLENIQTFFTHILIALVCILLIFGLFDAVWLGYLAKNLYKDEMQSLLREQFVMWPWLVFYLMYSCIIFILCIVPNREKPWFYAAIDGALLGAASYGAYNLTAYSIIEGFSLTIMLVDWSWGIFLSSIVACAGWFGFQLLRK
ncbi:DUF2177 family protein [Agaribacter flavus]|uniref:DUF2177 family protein n=1 Tax=Agaribacter flavus TaxID=1902781 RepID=A0ABV7FRL9_9ALTE